MNKNKLRSLMFHAGFCNEDGGWDTRPIHEQEYDNFQRFAELIVRECASTAEKWYSDYPSDDRSVSEAVKQHFGVEE